MATALSDIDEEDLQSPLLDEDLDPDMLDTEYEASRAAAYDEPRSKFDQDPESVRRRLRDSWQWYLDEAVSTAYSAVSE